MDNQNQYNFIMDPGSGASGPAFLQDPKKRILVAVAFVVIILLVVAIAVSVFLSLGSKGSAGVKDIIAYQTEILRVSELGLKDSKDINTRSKISTVQSFIASDLNQTRSLATGKISKEELAKFQDSKTTKALESAAVSNNFDVVVIKQIDELLSTYQAELAKVYSSTSAEDEKAILNTANQNVVIYEGL